jgi:hypothetical protein
LAAFFATRDIPSDVERLGWIYRVYRLPESENSESTESLSVFLRRPLLAPAFRDVAGARSARSVVQHEGEATSTHLALSNAIGELLNLHRSENLILPDKHDSSQGPVFALNNNARRTVSHETSNLLKAHGIELGRTPLAYAVRDLSDVKLSIPLPPLSWPSPPLPQASGATLPAGPGPPLVQPAGVADLLVVKQQIKRYDGAEIAHIENVLIGEKKSRAHRQLERTEETFMSETDNVRTRETELQTTDRFELNRETSRTIKDDQKLGVDLSLSGKYGPTIEFSSKFTMDTTTSKEESAKSSSRFAKDVMNRSLERITERVHEVRTRTIIRETEETNLHEFDNKTSSHISGIYQFLDKVYETQVFNYGVREMFDFMIPEPASFLWYVDQNPTLELKLPPPPSPLPTLYPDASYLTENNALQLAAEFGAEIDPPPLPLILVPAATKHGEDNASEGGQPRSVYQADLTIPAGYRLLWAKVTGLAVTDNDPVIAVGMGGQQVLWRPPSSQRVGLSSGFALAFGPDEYLWFSEAPYEIGRESKLQVSIIAYETNIYSVNLVLVVMRTEEAMRQWKLSVYHKIRSAYDDRRREYEQKVAELTSEAMARAERENQLPFGAPPAMSLRIITTELKKHCISLITQQWYDAFNATLDGQPPTFDLVDAVAEGSYIRFFEQAFEWDQLQFVFYPYFWARKSTWVKRFTRQDIDPQFLDFLRAGSARVVVPVRPGFEVAITHFMETGKLWNGAGQPPAINSPEYVSIIDEIRERTGAPQGEIPVGDPWDARVPTALVLVRPASDLPKWTRASPSEWSWLPDGTI